QLQQNPARNLNQRVHSAQSAVQQSAEKKHENNATKLRVSIFNQELDSHPSTTSNSEKNDHYEPLSPRELLKAKSISARKAKRDSRTFSLEEREQLKNNNFLTDAAKIGDSTVLASNDITQKKDKRRTKLFSSEEIRSLGSMSPPVSSTSPIEKETEKVSTGGSGTSKMHRLSFNTNPSFDLRSIDEENPSE
ncbi:12424_t:CDS:2, partial [Acaulospora morrowiae]